MVTEIKIKDGKVLTAKGCEKTFRDGRTVPYP